MKALNVLYHLQTNTWWTNKKIDGFTLFRTIKEGKQEIYFGTLTFTTNNKKELLKLLNKNDICLYEIDSIYIPNFIKKPYKT